MRIFSALLITAGICEETDDSGYGQYVDISITPPEGVVSSAWVIPQGSWDETTYLHRHHQEAVHDATRAYQPGSRDEHTVPNAHQRHTRDSLRKPGSQGGHYWNPLLESVQEKATVPGSLDERHDRDSNIENNEEHDHGEDEDDESVGSEAYDSDGSYTQFDMEIN